jgi:large subunit ribosomal protein L35
VMLRLLIPATRLAFRAPIVQNVVHTTPVTSQIQRSLSSAIPRTIAAPAPSLLANPKLTQISNNIISRNLIKFSMRKGKRKSVRAVHLRFYRLAWGGWVRTICGRHKRLWRKSPPRKRRLRQHVLCNATQSTLLDKMAGPYWTRRRYYVDDPYEPYHTREEYPLSATKPKPFDPPSGTVPYC